MKIDIDYARSGKPESLAWLRSLSLLAIAFGIIWLAITIWQFLFGSYGWFFLLMIPAFGALKLLAYRWYLQDTETVFDRKAMAGPVPEPPPVLEPINLPPAGTRPASSEKPRFDVINPATGKKVADFPVMDQDDVDKAVLEARKAFAFWSKSTFTRRRRILRKAAAVLADNADHYARVVANETGKTITDALLADIYAACDLLHYYSKNLHRQLAPVRVEAGPMLMGRRAYYTFEPKGVIAVIAPWNYPFTLSVGPVVSAVAAGNAVLLKPSSQTTACGLIVKEILVKAGLPENVVQVLTGSGSVTGEALINHPGLDMLFFTGSTAVGRVVNLRAAERLIPAVMELGGKDVAIVTARADLDRAAHAAVWGSFTNCGQTCIGTEIVLVERPVHDQLLNKMVAIVKEMKSGQGVGEVGSMTMSSQLAIVEEQVRDAVEKGAKVLTGGKRDESLGGMYYPPTILTDVTLDMKVMTDETFGPLLPVVPYDNIDEAIKIANSTPYGLSGAVFTRDMAEGRMIAGRIKAGSISINDCLVCYAVPALPFGGVKASGTGRYHGAMGIRGFTNVKSITEFNWDFKQEPYYYPMVPGADSFIRSALVALYSRNPLKRAVSGLTIARGAMAIYRKYRP